MTFTVWNSSLKKISFYSGWSLVKRFFGRIRKRLITNAIGMFYSVKISQLCLKTPWTIFLIRLTKCWYDSSKPNSSFMKPIHSHNSACTDRQNTTDRATRSYSCVLLWVSLPLFKLQTFSLRLSVLQIYIHLIDVTK